MDTTPSFIIRRVGWDYDRSSDPQGWRGGYSAEENRKLQETESKLVECKGCGEEWILAEDFDGEMHSCRKCW